MGAALTQGGLVVQSPCEIRYMKCNIIKFSHRTAFSKLMPICHKCGVTKSVVAGTGRITEDRFVSILSAPLTVRPPPSPRGLASSPRFGTGGGVMFVIRMTHLYEEETLVSSFLARSSVFLTANQILESMPWR